MHIAHSPILQGASTPVDVHSSSNVHVGSSSSLAVIWDLEPTRRSEQHRATIFLFDNLSNFYPIWIRIKFGEICTDSFSNFGHTRFYGKYSVVRPRTKTGGISPFFLIFFLFTKSRRSFVKSESWRMNRNHIWAQSVFSRNWKYSPLLAISIRKYS